MNDIRIYTTPTCPYCSAAKEYLREKGYPFHETDIAMDVSARDMLRKRGIMGVPAFDIGGTFFAGFDKERIEDLVDFRVISCPHCDQRMRAPKNKGTIRITCSSCSEKFDVKT